MFVFKFDKTIQAVAFLLRRETSKEMNYMRLIKILYIADRESIKRTGRPITGDRVAAMPQGPVLSELYDLIKGTHLRSPELARFFKKEDYKIRLVEDPGLANLSRFDIETIERVAEEFRAFNEWELVELTHKFPEWRKNSPDESQMKWISFTDILEALGRAPDPEIEEEAMEERAFARLFGD